MRVLFTVFAIVAFVTLQIQDGETKPISEKEEQEVLHDLISYLSRSEKNGQFKRFPSMNGGRQGNRPLPDSPSNEGKDDQAADDGGSAGEETDTPPGGENGGSEGGDTGDSVGSEIAPTGIENNAPADDKNGTPASGENTEAGGENVEAGGENSAPKGGENGQQQNENEDDGPGKSKGPAGNEKENAMEQDSEHPADNGEQIGGEKAEGNNDTPSNNAVSVVSEENRPKSTNEEQADNLIAQLDKTNKVVKELIVKLISALRNSNIPEATDLENILSQYLEKSERNNKELSDILEPADLALQKINTELQKTADGLSDTEGTANIENSESDEGDSEGQGHGEEDQNGEGQSKGEGPVEGEGSKQAEGHNSAEEGKPVMEEEPSKEEEQEPANGREPPSGIVNEEGSEGGGEVGEQEGQGEDKSKGIGIAKKKSFDNKLELLRILRKLEDLKV